MRISDWSPYVCSSDLAGAVKFDETADDALLAQHLRDGEHEIGRGDALAQRSGELEADDLGDQYRHRLAEHRGLRLDPADAPAEHAEAVDHRRVAVGADERVGIGNLVPVRPLRIPHRLAGMFGHDQLADAGAGGHDMEI